MKAPNLRASLQVGFALAAGALFLAPAPAAAEASPVIDFSKSDPAMEAAKAKARASIATFWSAYAAPKPNEEGFALKVGFPTKGTSAEHIWVFDVKREGAGRYTGRLANEPRDIVNKHAGDAVEFGEGQISDWMFLRNGKWVGAETIRPMIARMPKEMAAQYRQRFETP